MARQVKMHVKKGDTVMVSSGKEKGKSGKILSVNLDKKTVIVEKINFVKRHSKPSAKAPQGGIIEKEGRIHISNVNIICSKCDLPVRTKKKLLDDGKRVRACVKCGEIVDR